MTTNLTRKNFTTTIKAVLDYIEEHKVLKVLVIAVVSVATCKAIFQFGENFGHFLYMLTH